LPAGRDMDDRDKLLLTLLRRDARRSIVALARDLGLSRSATQERLARLQASGAIAGFTIVEGRDDPGRQSAYLMVAFEPGRRCAEIVPKLKRIPAVAMIHSMTGPVDLIVRLDAASVADIESARSAIVAVPGIASVSTSVVLERHLG
jgi:Lrp/AsnC family transcriptional regulator, leucine-responsive regulatory protein